MPVTTINWNFAPASVPDANSCGINHAAGDVLFDSVNPNTFPPGAVSTAIDAFLTAHGWSRVLNTHASGGGIAGRYAYSAPNLLDAAGAISYKYIILDFVASGKLIIRVFETIAAGNTAPINLSYTSDSSFTTMSTHTTGVASGAGKIWLGASARHIIVDSYYSGVYGCQATPYNDGGPIGCFELTRSSAQELVANGYPKFGFLCTGSIFCAGSDQYGFYVPRSRAGLSSNAARGFMQTAYGCGGEFGESNTTPYKKSTMPPLLNSVLGKPVASNLTAYSIAVETVGTLINCVAITRGYGVPIGDDIQIPLAADPNYSNEKFYSPTGVPTTMWLLGGASQALGRIAVPK